MRIVDPSKDLNSYGLGNVDWKERVEGWKLKQEKNIMQMTSRYSEGKGDLEGTGSNGEELQMLVRYLYFNISYILIYLTSFVHFTGLMMLDNL